jgi:adenosylcobalamin-dependent ribonucleoside-triphosphate reductase
MALMHWDDWQISQFIDVKQDSGSHWTTNISVEVDSRFWDESQSKPNGKANDILRRISDGMVRNGEPGFWDSSLNNVGEPNQVYACNPCSEIALEAWEPCNLGHINLAAFVSQEGTTDHYGLMKAHQLMTRFLIRATFSPVGDPKSREVLDRNRRIGVGHFGVASYIALMGGRYSEAPLDPVFRELLRSLYQVVKDSATSFSHQLRIPVPVKMTTVAPTGTIAKMPGVSEGIHPIFSKHFIRRIRFNHNSDYEALAGLVNQGYEVEEDLYAPNTAVVSIPTKDPLVAAVEAAGGDPDVVESADDLTLNEMLSFQAMYQMLWADNAVSFTANIRTDEYTAEDVAKQLVRFGGLLKGGTLFPEMSMPQSPYERISKEAYDAALAKTVEDSIDLECSTGACPVR